MRFYICRHCGNIVAYVRNTGVPVMCCGEKMAELVPNSTEASEEKHLPVVRREGAQLVVSVGSAAHPMQPEHYIEWVALQTRRGNQRIALQPGSAPEVRFCVPEDDEPEAVFAFCNLHGLWKA
ncbi:MAG: desulfoferrodoxin family protein [Clostridia bacterium]|nr:desulfoferrodoxin family protein [Clostridia bacterium]